MSRTPKKTTRWYDPAGRRAASGSDRAPASTATGPPSPELRSSNPWGDGAAEWRCVHPCLHRSLERLGAAHGTLAWPSAGTWRTRTAKRPETAGAGLRSGHAAALLPRNPTTTALTTPIGKSCRSGCGSRDFWPCRTGGITPQSQCTACAPRTPSGPVSLPAKRSISSRLRTSRCLTPRSSLRRSRPVAAT